jgi:O-antigen/teichoic acid export membrane protein
LSNWFAMAATLLVGFFLAPFVVHRLGNTAYGVWVIAISSVNYLNLLDLGMRSSVLRFVSKGHASGNHNEASEALSAALWVRLQISVVVVLLCGILALSFRRIFNVPEGLAVAAQESVLLIGIASAISMSAGVVGAVLSALNRYDLQSYITLVQLVLRAVGTVGVLLTGNGIVAIAICELVAAVIGSALLIWLVRKVYPELRISARRPRQPALRKMWSYSIYAFLLTVASQVIYQTDNLMVGVFVSAAAVTFYAIGNSLCRYTQQFIAAMTMTFNPAASAYETVGNLEGVRSLYYNGTRVVLALTLPIVITFIFRGRNFIAVWMGPQYATESGTVLAILAAALLFQMSNAPAAAIAWGVEKHRMIAMWAIPEAIANLALSIMLARRIGIFGVAIGTLIPALVVNLVVWPNYLSRIVPLRASAVFREIWGPMYLVAIPFAAASYIVSCIAPARTLVTFVVQTTALGTLFVFPLAYMFRGALKNYLPRAFKERLLTAVER